jgi:hypothetical protein
MPLPQENQLSRQSSEEFDSSRSGNRATEGIVRPADGTQRLRNEGMVNQVPAVTIANLTLTESWVEISSRPSSSSLSSIGDEIVTTGLRVQQDSISRRRRKSHMVPPSRIAIHERQTSSSSQEEYEESESEEDRVMTSSNEHVPLTSRVHLVDKVQRHNTGVESTDDDENATALGRVSDEAVFTPQPNVFSHPPSARNSQSQPVSGAYFPRNSYPSHQARQPYSGRSSSRVQHSHSPYNTVSPAHQADHDAALRASLTTLLSCAAAARGLPKRNQNRPGASTTARPEFTGIRLVPESELTGASPIASRPLSPSTKARSSPSVSDKGADADKGKRKAATTKPAVSSRAVKKKKVAVAEEAMISPTLLTWVVSAGVVVLVSVVGFGAGYAIGKEVGRQEALNGLSVSENTSCGKEAARQLSEIRRFRWSNGRGIVA